MNPSSQNRILPESSFTVLLALCLILGIAGCGSTSYSPPPPDTTPPSAPTALVVTAVSRSQINLSWTASTDNVAVTGYKAERCSTPGCSTFTQIATPSGTTYNDPGLAGSTSYSYRVRATDAAGNLSTYSGAQSATTAVAAISVQLTPIRGGATLSQSLAFNATLQNDISSAGVTWTSSAGSFSAQGKTTATFVAPSTTGNVTVTATSVADTSQTASATIAVTDLPGVYTYHNDISRTGANLHEFALTTANVNATTFGKLFSCTVDAAVYAQPLWMSNLTIGGASHNVVYVATEHDTVYAFDADANPCATLWKTGANSVAGLVPTGERSVTSNDVGCGDLVPDIGITGTPVIDSATHTLYLVTKTSNTAGTAFHQRLHALDLLTGNEKFSGPRDISASVPGTGTAGTGSVVSFDPFLNGQRAALLLTNGHVILSWASHCDNGPYLGWLISYTASTLAQEAVFNASPNGTLAGIWMAGGGPAADTSGNIYFATGNGLWDGITNFGDSIVKLGPQSAGSFGTLDYFTPTDQGNLETFDIDLGSGGVLLLPDLTGPHAHLLVQVGKEGTIYTVNRDNLGKMCSGSCSTGDTQIVQEHRRVINGMWGSPAYWNFNLYFGGAQDGGGSGDNLKAFSVTPSNSQPLSSAPTSQSTHVFTFSGPTPSVSANGATNAIVWALDNSAFGSSCPTSCQVVYAYDATNLGTLLYNSSQAASNRDRSGGAVKFTVPTVANGKVYVGGQSTITVYGLLPN